MNTVNPERITFARIRRRWSKARLASELGVTARSIQNYEAGATAPDPTTLAELARLLNFPQQFFFAQEAMPCIGEHAASFRALSRMTASMRACATSAGAIAFLVNDWLEQRFHLPELDLPDLSDLPPVEAAATLRRMWGLGYEPIDNMVHLLESKGIRVFSLVEESRDVDAFCTWHEGRAFVFLNTQKTAERSRFDAAHELGHLVRDVYSMRHGQEHSPEMERNANVFAAAFLMPEQSIASTRPAHCTFAAMVKTKKHWKVSLASLAYRYHSLGLISDWHYRNLCVEIAQAGYRRGEPDGIAREESQLLSKVFAYLAGQGSGRRDIARDLNISVKEIHDLTFGLTLSVLDNKNAALKPSGRPQPRTKTVLRLVAS